MVSVSKILTFTFCHLVIPGVSFYSCLCLEIVPLFILLPSVSRPGRQALSSEFQWSEHSLQASSPLTGRCTDIWCSDLLLAEDEGPKQNLSQKLCCFGLSQKPLASVVHTLTCVYYFWWSPGTKMAPADPEAKASRAGWTHVLWPGRWPDVWGPKRVVPQLLCGSRLSQKLSASVMHTPTCAD